MKFRILVVCTANVCRSPLAAALIAAGFDRAEVAGVEVSSAGTSAVPGAPVCSTTLLGAGGLVLDRSRLAFHQAAELTADQVRGSDLVLTADRSSRAAVARLVPDAHAPYFTLREAAELSRQVATPPTRELLGGPEERLSSFVQALREARGLTDQPRTQRLRSWSRPWRSTLAHSHDVPDAHQTHHGLHPAVVEAVEAASRQLGDRLLCWSGVSDSCRP